LKKEVQKKFPNAFLNISFSDEGVTIDIDDEGEDNKRGIMDTCTDKNSSKVTAALAWEVTNSTYLPNVDRNRISGPYIGTNTKNHSCTVTIKVAAASETNIGAIIGGAVGGSLLLLLIVAFLFLWYFKRNLDLSSLPPKVRWQYEQYQANPSLWQKVAATGNSNPYYRKKITKGSNDYDHLTSLLYDFFETDAEIVPDEAWAIYNPTLISNFINNRKIMSTRFYNDPENFAKTDWLDSKDPEDKAQAEEDRLSRNCIIDKLENRLEDANCNEKVEARSLLPILPCCHGTDFNIAMAICSTGFAALSSLDAGWYGAGVYFTTYTMYATPYFSNRKDPSIIISFVTPGNAFPVIRKAPGEVLKVGFNCNYVVVEANGEIPEQINAKKVDNSYDELVIPQESQISPVYVIRFDPDSLKAFMSTYDRNRNGRGRREAARERTTQSSKAARPALKKTKSYKLATLQKKSTKRTSAAELQIDENLIDGGAESFKVPPKKLFMLIVPGDNGRFEKITVSNSDTKTVRQLLDETAAKRSLDYSKLKVSVRGGDGLDSLDIPLSEVPERILVLQPPKL